MQNHHFSAVADIADLDSNVDDLECLGSNLHAPTPDDEGLTTVVVDDVVINIEDYILTR